MFLFSGYKYTAVAISTAEKNGVFNQAQTQNCFKITDASAQVWVRGLRAYF